MLDAAVLRESIENVSVVEMDLLQHVIFYRRWFKKLFFDQPHNHNKLHTVFTIR